MRLLRPLLAAVLAFAAASALLVSVRMLRLPGHHEDGGAPGGLAPAGACPGCAAAEEGAEAGERWAEEDAAARSARGGGGGGLPTVLVLTPVKNAARHVDRYFANLRRLT